jgi:hypothetical protein
MLRGQGRSIATKSICVESRPLGAPEATPIEEAPPTPSPQEVAPPGTRVLASSFKEDGSRWRPGERLEKQAREWARGQAQSRESRGPKADRGGAPRWSRTDAKRTLERLMSSLDL